jgi:hypothetical protein
VGGGWGQAGDKAPLSAASAVQRRAAAAPCRSGASGFERSVAVVLADYGSDQHSRLPGVHAQRVRLPQAFTRVGSTPGWGATGCGRLTGNAAYGPNKTHRPACCWVGTVVLCTTRLLAPTCDRCARQLPAEAAFPPPCPFLPVAVDARARSQPVSAIVPHDIPALVYNTRYYGEGCWGWGRACGWGARGRHALGLAVNEAGCQPGAGGWPPRRAAGHGSGTSHAIVMDSGSATPSPATCDRPA